MKEDTFQSYVLTLIEKDILVEKSKTLIEKQRQQHDLMFQSEKEMSNSLFVEALDEFKSDENIVNEVKVDMIRAKYS